MKEKKLVGIVNPPYSEGKSSNIGNLKDTNKIVGITSPPYAESMDNKGKRHGDSGICGRDPNMVKMRYDSEGKSSNIGNLKDTNNTEEFDITQFHSCSDSLYWHGCYSSDARFKGFMHPDTFAHPAKMSMLLCDRIFKHLKKLGLLKAGDVICDFMSGTGRTGIMASLHGFDSIHVELEPHFIKMINQNKELLEKKIGRKVNWQVIQGDARKLTELLKEKNLVGITSPPFEDAMGQDGGKKILQVFEGRSYTEGKAYSDSQENLGNQQGESYLSAMFQVYSQAAQLMSIIVTVTKNPTRRGQLRRLDIDTAKLLMACGYVIVDYHRAMLFEERKQATLIGGTRKDLKGRLSFFKRLSVQRGNVAAQFEDIIIAIRKDLG